MLGPIPPIGTGVWMTPRNMLLLSAEINEISYLKIKLSKIRNLQLAAFNVKKLSDY